MKDTRRISGAAEEKVGLEGLILKEDELHILAESSTRTESKEED